MRGSLSAPIHKHTLSYCSPTHILHGESCKYFDIRYFNQFPLPKNLSGSKILFPLDLEPNDDIKFRMIRKANVKDIKPIYGLLQMYGNKGELLPRPLSKLYDHVRDFFVYTDENETKIIGCCALQFCWEDLAEIRSLAVHPEYHKRKIGATLVEAALSEAKSYDIAKVFTLTYQPDFFKKYGFSQIDKNELPLKIWGDCLLCVKFPDCDETAMMKIIA